MEKKTIGFVGLGLMGNGMAKNLLSDGFSVVGFDIDKIKIDPIIELGGQCIDAPEHLASQVDVIILSLPNSHVVNNVVKEFLKLFESGRKDLILIDTTTADPIMSETLATRLRENGIEMLDATLSGTSKMCAEKDVVFMVGGKEKIFKECESLFSAMGKQTFYMGKVWLWLRGYHSAREQDLTNADSWKS